MRIKDKLENYARVDQVLAELVASIPEGEVEHRTDAKTIFKDLKEKVMRDEILDRGQRLDGRRFDEIRPIWIETGVLPRVHGSAVFTRGETQALVSATLGTEDDAQKIETVEGETYKRFLLHYNFPPFSVGEVQFLRGPGRREIGHGALAERALTPVLPSNEDFPYTLRVVSDILESNGSSSMASVCGGTLALMDAGVPLKAPVAGVAMGLVMNEETGKWAVLTRHRRRRGSLRRHGLQGRRHRGRASPRCRWTSRSAASRWTSCGRRSSRRARAGSRSCDKMAEALAAPRAEHLRVSRRASSRCGSRPRRSATSSARAARPSAASSRRPASRSTSRTTAASTSRRPTRARRSARSTMIKELTATPELDTSYLGRVERITDFGAFIEIMPGVDGLLHVSEIANYRVKDVRDELKEGEQIMVKVINVDPSGKVRLSRKALLAPDEGTAPRDPRPVHDGPSDSGGGHREHRERGRGGDRGRPRRPTRGTESRIAGTVARTGR